jgi:hypothetical protein
VHGPGQPDRRRFQARRCTGLRLLKIEFFLVDELDGLLHVRDLAWLQVGAGRQFVGSNWRLIPWEYVREDESFPTPSQVRIGWRGRDQEHEARDVFALVFHKLAVGVYAADPVRASVRPGSLSLPPPKWLVVSVDAGLAKGDNGAHNELVAASEASLGIRWQ